MQQLMPAAKYSSVIGFSAALIFWGSLPNSLSAQGNASPCGTGPEYAKREVHLKSTVNEILDALRTHDSRVILRHIDNDGVSVWGGDLSSTEIRKEFHEKSGLYCLLFSTACVETTRFPGNAYINTSKWKMSYSEWLSRHSHVKIDPEMFYGGEDNPCHANVSIRSESKAYPDEETFELGFDFRKDSWKLVSTPAYPEGIASIPSSKEIVQQRTEAPKWQP